MVVLAPTMLFEAHDAKDIGEDYVHVLYRVKCKLGCSKAFDIECISVLFSL